MTDKIKNSIKVKSQKQPNCIEKVEKGSRLGLRCSLFAGSGVFKEYCFCHCPDTIVENNVDECSICQQTMTVQWRTSCCKQAYCKKCIIEYQDKFIKSNGKMINCPTCRKPMNDQYILNLPRPNPDAVLILVNDDETIKYLSEIDIENPLYKKYQYVKYTLNFSPNSTINDFKDIIMKLVKVRYGLNTTWNMISHRLMTNVDTDPVKFRYLDGVFRKLLFVHFPEMLIGEDLFTRFKNGEDCSDGCYIVFTRTFIDINDRGNITIYQGNDNSIMKKIKEISEDFYDEIRESEFEKMVLMTGVDDDDVVDDEENKCNCPVCNNGNDDSD